MTVVNLSVKLYADECFSGFVVEDLRRLGYDVLTVKENGKANQSISDAEVLKDAILLGRAVITVNRKDFRKLNTEYTKSNLPHYGIITCTQPKIRGFAQKIHTAIQANTPLSNKIVNIHN